MKLAYCDYIAHLIKTYVLAMDNDHQKLIDEVGHVQFDIGNHGEYLSTTKTIDVLDINEKQYRITVQEL